MGKRNKRAKTFTEGLPGEFMLETERRRRISEFYKGNPRGACCDECVKKLSSEEREVSGRLTGLRLCLACLEKHLPKKCEVCGKSGCELNSYGEFKQVCFACFCNLDREGVKKMTELGDFAKRNSQFITLADGESVEAVYKDYVIAPNSFDPEKETVNYKLETEYGTKTFRSGACGLARLFEKIKKGSKVKITRNGTGNKTSYQIEHEVDGGWATVGKEEEEE